MKIDKTVLNRVKKNWILASKKFHFEITCPFTINLAKGERDVFAFLPSYGSENGMIIDLISAPNYDIDNDVVQWAKQNDCYYSFINVDQYLDFNEELFIETLEDWGNRKAI